MADRDSTGRRPPVQDEIDGDTLNTIRRDWPDLATLCDRAADRRAAKTLARTVLMRASKTLTAAEINQIRQLA